MLGMIIYIWIHVHSVPKIFPGETMKNTWYIMIHDVFLVIWCNYAKLFQIILVCYPTRTFFVAHWGIGWKLPNSWPRRLAVPLSSPVDDHWFLGIHDGILLHALWGYIYIYTYIYIYMYIYIYIYIYGDICICILYIYIYYHIIYILLLYILYIFETLKP